MTTRTLSATERPVASQLIKDLAKSLGRTPAETCRFLTDRRHDIAAVIRAGNPDAEANLALSRALFDVGQVHGIRALRSRGWQDSAIRRALNARLSATETMPQRRINAVERAMNAADSGH